MSSIAQAKTTTAKVVETYTSHVVWLNHKEVGFVWLTSQGALETWNDFLSPYQSSKIYNYYPNAVDTNIPAEVGFQSSPAVFAYYNNAFKSLQGGTKLAYSNTIYSFHESAPSYPYQFLAENAVPQFGVKSGLTVKRLSNNEYLYPNDKEYHFSGYQMIPRSEAPQSLIAMSSASYGTSGNVFYFRRLVHGVYQYSSCQ